jgi:hypothetical protein
MSGLCLTLASTLAHLAQELFSYRQGSLLISHENPFTL